MILEQIKNPDFFNNSEQNMIYFLQNNLNSFDQVTLNKMAKESFSSTSSVLRFCKKFTAFTYTFSRMFLPNNPAGRNNRMTIKIMKAAASRNVEDRKPLTSASMTPSRMPPTMAPGITPIPPSTAATNALRPGMMPISGSIEL